MVRGLFWNRFLSHRNSSDMSSHRVNLLFPSGPQAAWRADFPYILIRRLRRRSKSVIRNMRNQCHVGGAVVQVPHSALAFVLVEALRPRRSFLRHRSAEWSPQSDRSPRASEYTVSQCSFTPTPGADARCACHQRRLRWNVNSRHFPQVPLYHFDIAHETGKSSVFLRTAAAPRSCPSTGEPATAPVRHRAAARATCPPGGRAPRPRRWKDLVSRRRLPTAAAVNSARALEQQPVSPVGFGGSPEAASGRRRTCLRGWCQRPPPPVSIEYCAGLRNQPPAPADPQ